MRRSAKGIGALIANQFLLVCILSCSSEQLGSTQPQQATSFGGTRHIPSKDALLRLGGTDAPISPGLTRFAHDFWLDTTEVTQGEYVSLFGRNPPPSSERSPRNPVVNVTWFDAVLFCNARSKRDHFDTVYDYNAISADSTGSVWALHGLASHLERNGWRLPSEAEWEYADRAGGTTIYPWGSFADSSKAPEYAWFQRNSGGSLHEVARLKPNPWGFYDMAGNAMEWVQDWKGAFPKDTVTDFVGPDVPGDVPETPLKSGAYTYGLEHLKPSSRSATYPAYRSAKAEYVGFRCARGGFTPTYTNSSGQTVQAPPVSILRSDVARMLGAQSARLVFLNRTNGKGILSWIDFGEPAPVVRSLMDADPVFHPVISPDGQWVAWCTVKEGTKGASRIKARRLTKNDSTVLDLGSGAIPRWWVDGTDTFLVRAGSAMDNTESDWSGDRTMAQRWSNAKLTGSVQTWSDAGGYHDGRSGRFLYTGYRRLKQIGVSGQGAKTLFTYPRNGKAVGDTSQVCNVSAAPDGSGRVMFLDFGYNGKSSVVGRPYGIHEVAFVADSAGDVVKTFPVALGKSQWDHLEWSNHPRWAAGIALEPNGSDYKEAHLLDLETGNTTPLIRGTELWMPQLWVGAAAKPAENMQSDSLFRYGFPDGAPENVELTIRLPLFWRHHLDVEAVAVGSSQVGDGIMPGEFKSIHLANLGFAGARFEAERTLLLDYIVPHAPKLKVVILPLMPGWLFNDKRSTLWDKTLRSKGAVYDRNHQLWPDSLPNGWLDQTTRLFQTYIPKGIFDTMGNYFDSHNANGWQTSAPSLEDESFGRDATDPVLLQSFDSLQALVKHLGQRKIATILVAFPQSPGYRNTTLAGRYGPKWGTYKAIKAIVQGWKIPGFQFYDAYQDGMHDYGENEAVDCDHLSFKGAVKLSGRLDSLIRASKEANP